MSAFGTVCVDECHHLAAPVMNKAMRSFAARNVFGLTATKTRPDGLTNLLHWTLGPEAFRAEREGGETVKVSIVMFPTGIPEVRNKDGKPITSILLTKLANCRKRNRFLAERICTMHRNGRVIMVLADRIKQLENIRDMVLEGGVPQEEVGMFHATTKGCERHGQLSRSVVLHWNLRPGFENHPWFIRDMGAFNFRRRRLRKVDAKWLGQVSR